MMEKYRKKLNQIDESMRNLFVERMALVKEIALYKKTHQLPIEDLRREEKMTKRLAIEDPVINRYYQAFLKYIIQESKQYQIEVIKEDI
jgi:chorismate mutase